jgi:hypothetical protein
MASRPPASEAGAYPGSATSADERAAGPRVQSGRLARVMQPAAVAAARVVPPRAAPCGGPRVARPWPDAVPAGGVPLPGRGGDASPPPLCVEGRRRRPPAQRTPRAKSETSCGVAVSKPTTSSIAPGGARTRDLSIRSRYPEPLRPATILLTEQACQGSNPDQRGWSSPCFRLHHRPVQSGRPGSNGPPRRGAPVLFRLSYVREVVRPAGVEPAASAVARQRSLR